MALFVRPGRGLDNSQETVIIVKNKEELSRIIGVPVENIEITFQRYKPETGWYEHLVSHGEIVDGHLSEPLY